MKGFHFKAFVASTLLGAFANAYRPAFVGGNARTSGLKPVASAAKVLFQPVASIKSRRVDLVACTRRRALSELSLSSHTVESDDAPRLKQVPPEMEGVPIPFVDVQGNSFIECYADSVAHLNGQEYTIGVPCDYAVALCYYEEDGQLTPIEMDDYELMDDVFPVAESIVAEGVCSDLWTRRGHLLCLCVRFSKNLLLCSSLSKKYISKPKSLERNLCYSARLKP